jgi:hypothetical protein
MDTDMDVDRDRDTIDRNKDTIKREQIHKRTGAGTKNARETDGQGKSDTEGQRYI